MANKDPRIAALAQTVASRLALDRSLGVEHMPLLRVPQEEIPVIAASAAESQPVDSPLPAPPMPQPPQQQLSL